MEEIIMNIILNAGNAKSNSLKAIDHAIKNEFTMAKELMVQVKNDLSLAHNIQTKIIQSEVRGEKKEISLLMIHAQDHLTMGLMSRDFAELFIRYAESNYNEIKQLKERGN